MAGGDSAREPEEPDHRHAAVRILAGAGRRREPRVQALVLHRLHVPNRAVEGVHGGLHGPAEQRQVDSAELHVRDALPHEPRPVHLGTVHVHPAHPGPGEPGEVSGDRGLGGAALGRAVRPGVRPQDLLVRIEQHRPAAGEREGRDEGQHDEGFGDHALHGEQAEELQKSARNILRVQSIEREGPGHQDASAPAGQEHEQQHPAGGQPVGRQRRRQEPRRDPQVQPAQGLPGRAGHRLRRENPREELRAGSLRGPDLQVVLVQVRKGGLGALLASAALRARDPGRFECQEFRALLQNV